MKIVLEIPIKPHLKRYVQYVEKLEAAEALKVSLLSPISMLVAVVLTFKSNVRLNKNMSIPAGATDTLRIEIGRHYVGRDLMFTPNTFVATFNNYLHRYMHEDLNHYIASQKEHGVTKNASIWKFMRMTEMEDFIEYDTLKKANDRLRERKNRKTIQNPPFFPAKVSG